MNNNRAIVLCEHSGSMRDALRRCGWDAYSCDLKPDDFESPYHLQCDVHDIDYGDHDNPTFNLIIAHPPCQYLSVVGYNTAKGDRKLLREHKASEAIEFVRSIMRLPCNHMAIENPRSLIASHIRPSDQMIQPYEYGHDAKKGTCLWLKNLPKLRPTHIIEPKYACKCTEKKSISEHKSYRFDKKLGKYGCPWCNGETGPARLVYGNQTSSGHGKKHPEMTSTAKTFPGIAKAMAEQWTDFIRNEGRPL